MTSSSAQVIRRQGNPHSSSPTSTSGIVLSGRHGYSVEDRVSICAFKGLVMHTEVLIDLHGLFRNNSNECLRSAREDSNPRIMFRVKDFNNPNSEP